MYEQDRHSENNVTLNRVRPTIVIVENQYVLRILSVYL